MVISECSQQKASEERKLPPFYIKNGCRDKTGTGLGQGSGTSSILYVLKKYKYS